jgi:hypothetical protein
LVLLVLAVIWAAVLVPPMWRSRADGRPADSIKQFHRHLRVLNGTEPHGYSRALTAQVGSPVVTAPMSYRTSMRSSAELRRRRTIERRRNVLFCLAGGAALTLVLAIAGLPMMLATHLIVDVLLAAYVGLLLYMRSAAAERDMKLRFLPNQSVLDLRDAVAWDEAPAYATVGAR